MLLSSILSLFACITATTFALPSVLAPVSDLFARDDSPCGPDYCAGTNNTQDEYFCGDARLGPKILPQKIPLDNLVVMYDRLGGLCPAAFLAKWYDTNANSYIYPSQNGFQLDIVGAPIDGSQMLTVGMLLDRFGSEYGTFLSPYGAPYGQRSLPPSNLDTPQNNPQYPYNYHIYEVLQEFAVLSGPIAPWLGQPGQGTQYQTSSDIMTLVSDGYLKAVNPST